MRIGIATVQVPFITGGAEIHARLLKEQLEVRGHVVDIITLPFKWYPPQVLLDSIKAVEFLDLTEVNGQKIELLITMKFPMYYVNHPNKVVWLLHQHRQAYELYETRHSDLHLSHQGRDATQQIRCLDTRKLPLHRLLFTNSKNVANRLWRYNRVHAEALYHPPEDYEQLFCDTYGDYILVPGRLDEMKRQLLMVEALVHQPSLKLILIGNADTPYGDALRKKAQTLGIHDRVVIKGFVSREDKVILYANALAVYNGAYEEDYGYITLESFFSSKPVITHTDSGGPLEFVVDQENGFVTEPSAISIAAALNKLSVKKAQKLGEKGRQLMLDLNLNWNFIVDSLLQSEHKNL
jgi:glycosyltransferase involved in cell wall biosynthesis